MKSISLLTDGIYPHVIGGMQKHSYYLVKYLSMNGIHVDLYHTGEGHLKNDEEKLFTDEQKRFIHPVVIPFPKAGWVPGHYLKESYSYSCRVFEAMQKREPTDFIYAKGFAGWRFFEKRKHSGILTRAGVNFHGYEMFQPAFGLRSKIESYLLKGPVRYNTLSADYVFSYGGNITRIIKGLGVKADRILEIPTGIEPAWINRDVISTGGKRKFIFIGRNERRKGLGELNAVLKKIAAQADFSFDFVGPIPESDRIRSEKVTYHGEISDQGRMRELLIASDILVCPSHSEGMPNVIMEAMASGLAVIATDVGAISGMLDERNGWLIRAGDPGQLEEAILKGIREPASSLDAKKNASVSRVEMEFRWDKLILQTMDKINSTIAG